MPRVVRDSRLENRTQRDRLTPRRKPYWRTVLPQELHLGYRRRAAGQPGAWIEIARHRVGGRYREAALGLADDFAAADGDLILSFAQAQARALERHREGRGRPPGRLTVADAHALYVASKRAARRPTADAEQRYRLYVAPTLGDRPVADLTTEELEAWLGRVAASPRFRGGRKAGGRLRAPPTTPDATRARHASANRVLTQLKATLNHAYRRGRADSADAWGRRLSHFREVGNGDGVYEVNVRRERVLSADEAAPRYESA